MKICEAECRFRQFPVRCHPLLPQWLPVFTSPADPIWKRIHVFAYFAGRDRDCEENPGSANRLLAESRNRWPGIQSKNLQITLTAADARPDKIASLTSYFHERSLIPPGLRSDHLTGNSLTAFELMNSKNYSLPPASWCSTQSQIQTRPPLVQNQGKPTGAAAVDR